MIFIASAGLGTMSRKHGSLCDALDTVTADEEVKVTLEHVHKAKDRRKAWEDVQWAIINAKEFLFRH